MFINYYKGRPNHYAIAFRDGNITAQGAGINFWYTPWMTSIAVVPMASQKTPFIFTEMTSDYQEIAIQGALSYRFAEPDQVARRLDFTVDQKTHLYKTDDPEKLVERVINAVQAHTRGIVNRLMLETTLTRVPELAEEVLNDANFARELSGLGVEIESLHFGSVKAMPEMQKALEADLREQLNKRADQAIYDRRSAAAKEERKLREDEMNMEVELENRRKDLVDMQARNSLALAEADAKAEEMRLDPYGALPPQALVGLALKEWAGNAGNIGNLSITPDMLDRIVGWIANTNQ